METGMSCSSSVFLKEDWYVISESEICVGRVMTIEQGDL